MPDRISATGTCARCDDPLDLASVKVAERWYCRPACAAGVEPTRDRVSADALTNRPRRRYGRRRPKELRRPE